MPNTGQRLTCGTGGEGDKSDSFPIEERMCLDKKKKKGKFSEILISHTADGVRAM